jgi:dTMP kinase
LICALQGKETPAEDRFERETIEFHRKIRRGYLALAGNEPERFRIIDASQDIAAIHREVCLHLELVLKIPAGGG